MSFRHHVIPRILRSSFHNSYLRPISLLSFKHPVSSTFQRSVKPAPIPLSLRRVSFMSFLSGLLTRFSTSARSTDKMDYPHKRTDDEWRAVLNPEQFRILRGKGTEAAFTGEYDKHRPTSGVYNCAGCNAPLYKAEHKFASGCGWPAYFDCIPGAVTRHEDRSFGMTRTEIVCSNCGGHLGHVFKGEGYSTPTDERHCVNSVSLKFSGEGGEAK